MRYSEIVDLNGEGILIEGENYEEPTSLPGLNKKTALINLKDDVFKGIGFLNMDPRILLSEKFDQILSTFKFTK